MDEKTEQLRDIFLDVADDGRVTERQEEGRGSLVGGDGDREAAVRAVVDEMRERYEFRTGLDDDALVRVVEGVFEGEDDAALAAALDVDREVVVRARLDLHLLREADREAPFDFEELRRLVVEDVPVPEAADRLDASESTVRRYRAVAEAELESRRVSDRFRDEFADLFADVAGERFTTDAKRHGLEDAIAGGESESDTQL